MFFPNVKFHGFKEDKAVRFYGILCVYTQITFVTIIILQGITSPREELLLNLNFIQQNNSFC